jgi:formate dehydrogenase subunit delta
MEVDKLVKMANQIGSFFEAMPDRPEAEKGVVQHIRKFWDPSMRRAFLAHLDHDGGDGGLSGMVSNAVRAHRSLLE